MEWGDSRYCPSIRVMLVRHLWFHAQGQEEPGGSFPVALGGLEGRGAGAPPRLCRAKPPGWEQAGALP